MDVRTNSDYFHMVAAIAGVDEAYVAESVLKARKGDANAARGKFIELRHRPDCEVCAPQFPLNEPLPPAWIPNPGR